MRAPGVAVLAVLVAAAAAAPAGAAITSSNITAPADGTHYLVTDVDAAHPEPVTGTSNGTTGDSVDVRCYERTDRWQDVNAGVPVAADGSFSTTIQTDDPYGLCVLRAVPHNLPASSDTSAFTGPTLDGEQNISYRVGGGPNDGKIYNYFVQYQQPNALNDYVSAFEGGLYDSRLQYAPDHASAYLWYGDGQLDANDNLSANNRSSLQVDNFNAYGPYTAQQLFKDNEGLPALTYDTTRDAAAGTTTIHETDPIVRCSTEDAFPPTALSCPKFVSAGVQLERTIVSDDGGKQVHITDTWRDTAHQAHTLSLHYSEWASGYSADENSTVEIALKLPWLGDFATFSSETTFPGPGPGAGTVFVRDNNAAPDGDEAYPVGSISFDVAPNDVRRLSRQHAYLRYENVAVPADGTAVIRQDFASGQTLADVAAKATAQVDRFSPPTVAITSPANGSTVKGARSPQPVTVTGTAADNVGIASLTLNGVPVTVSGGSFSAPASLALGSNTLTAVATDAAGNTATATATVTYADNVAPNLSGFKATPSTFAVGPKATAITAKAKRGTTFKLKLSEDATVAITIAQCRNASCKKVKSRGTLHRTLKGGARSVKFSGRIGKRKLAAGRYVATAVATDKAGNKSKRKSLKLRVVQR